jgi:uncharacterized Zn-binding protein involved in type VI secretion
MPPAARVADPTTHGAPLAPGPGSTDVLIGYMPAWRALMDQHACPAVSITGPDGVGMVMMGSPTVLIDYMMACRLGDIVVEIPGLAMGPANPIIMGCPTVQIGEVGMGGAATEMGMGMSLAKSSAVGTTSQNPSIYSKPASPQALVAVPASFTPPSKGGPLQFDSDSGDGAGGGSTQDSQKEKKIVCGIVANSLHVNCQHKGRKPEKGLLAVVPSMGGDTIHCVLQSYGSCGPHPTWEIGGYWTSTKHGADISFDAHAFQALPKERLKLPVWLGDIDPHVYAVNVSSCAGPSYSFQINAYPNDAQEITIDSETFHKTWDALIDGVEETISSLVSEPFKVEYLKGKGNASAQWQEDDESSQAFYSWKVSAAFSPLVGARFRLPLGPQAVPPGLSKFGNAGFFVQVKGEINAKASGGQLNPPGKGGVEGHFEAALEGALSLAVGGSAFLGRSEEDPVVSVEVALECGLEAKLTGVLENLRPVIKGEASVGNLKGNCTFQLLFYSKKSEVTILEGKKFWDDKFYFFKPSADALDTQAGGSQ